MPLATVFVSDIGPSPVAIPSRFLVQKWALPPFFSALAQCDVERELFGIFETRNRKNGAVSQPFPHVFMRVAYER